MAQQGSLDLEFTMHDAGMRVLGVLENCGDWMRMKELAQMTKLDERTIRKVIVEYLRNELSLSILSCEFGYKLSRDPDDIELHRKYHLSRGETWLKNYINTMRIPARVAVETLLQSFTKKQIEKERKG